MRKLIDMLSVSVEMALSQLKRWLCSPRVLILSFFVAAQCFAQVCGFQNTLNRYGYSAHLMESIFYQFYSGCNMPMMSVLFLVMIGDIPYQMAQQEFFLIRCSRRKWMAAQIMHCVLIVMVMILILLILTTGMLLPISEEGNGWSDDQRMSDCGSLPQTEMVMGVIRQRFSPISAICVAILPMACFWLLMLLMIMAFGMRGIPEVGILIYASLLVLNITVLFEMIPFDVPFPLEYATLEGIVAKQNAGNALELNSVLCGYGVVILIIILVLFRCADRCELSFRVR